MIKIGIFEKLFGGGREDEKIAHKLLTLIQQADSVAGCTKRKTRKEVTNHVTK